MNEYPLYVPAICLAIVVVFAVWFHWRMQRADRDRDQ